MGLNASINESTSCWYCERSSVRWGDLRIISQAWRPCVMALRLDATFPSEELGPVDFLALRRLAAICFALVAIGGSFTEQCADAFWGEVVGKVGGANRRLNKHALQMAVAAWQE